MNRETPVDRGRFAQAAVLAATAAYGLRPQPARAASALESPAIAASALESPAIAAIGIDGKGATDVRGAVAAGFRLAALVDVVDIRKAGAAVCRAGRARSGPNTRTCRFSPITVKCRRKWGDKIDAVTVSTPDHHHFHASYLASKAGKHFFCPKPLTHGPWEARTLPPRSRT